ncbi:MAG: hypothetical protein LBP65_03030 [Puniceicoccales bacterium]|nr:hypothetical protein [Puniceicoccales bacterium]
MPEFTESQSEQPAQPGPGAARSPRRRRNPIVSNARRPAESQRCGPAIGPCEGATVIPFQGNGRQVGGEREGKYSTAVADRGMEKDRRQIRQRQLPPRRDGEPFCREGTECHCHRGNGWLGWLKKLWPFGKKQPATGQRKGGHRRSGNRKKLYH